MQWLAQRAAMVGVAVAFLFIAAPPIITAQTVSTRQLINGGTTTIRPAAQGSGELQQPELPPGLSRDQKPDPTHRRQSKEHDNDTNNQHQELNVPVVAPTAIAPSNPGLGPSFNGLNFRDQRIANGGNQFSVEPPDQGLCVGNGFVLETINSVLRVYDTAGTALVGTTDLNTFYGYPAAIDRRTGVRGPFVTDPSCHFDPDTQRWFHVVLTLDVLPEGTFTGRNHLDLAISTTASPLGTWNIYRLPAQNDGTEGTPNHGCSPGPVPPGTPPSNPRACIGDYPHIGADKYGFFITTNEYSFFGPEYKSAQIYAISKKALASGVARPAVTQFGHTVVRKAGTPGFTVWPAIAPAGRYATEHGGTEFFLSSMAAEEAGNTTGFDNRLGLWALTNTQSLDSARPELTLSSLAIDSQTYGIPPRSNQKRGDFPLGQCVNDTKLPTPFGPGCWQYFFDTEPAHDEVEGPLDSNDTRMQQVVYANGLVWGALDTVVNVGGVKQAGIAWFAVRPVLSDNGRRISQDSEVAAEGYVAAANNNLIYPAIAVLPGGKGVMTFTLVGTDHFPSAAYTPLQATTGENDLRVRTGQIHVAAAGLGPQDGFTEYKSFVGNPPRPRWGDYGAAVVDGSSIWMASSYIGQSCTLAQYATNTAASPLFTCGRTRAAFGNWYTRISRLTP